MKTSILSIGSELNLGQIVNTNSQFIAEEIAAIGLECNFMMTARDEIDDIVHIVKMAQKVSDIILISGGLGPTSDDITREAVAKAFGLSLVKDSRLDATSTKFLKRIKNENIQKNLLKQSYIPQGSKPFVPKVGSASGFYINKNKKHIFSIPGVPKEMKSMFEADVIPLLKEILHKENKGEKTSILKRETLLTTDISESEIEDNIREIIKKTSKDNVKIGITAAPGLIKIIIVVEASSQEEADKKIKKYVENITKKVGNYIYGREKSLLTETIKPLLESRKYTLCVAESITGGLISSLITDIPGSSSFFLGGIVSYSDFSKSKILDIDKDIIESHGAVSEKTCVEMVCNVKKIFRSDYALSVTGFAGPDADEAKNLGIVYCALKGPEGDLKVFKKKFLGNRTEIKFRVAQFVLNKLRLELSQ